MTEKAKRSTWFTVILVLLPVWLIASGAGALWYYFRLEKKEALVEQQRFSRAVSVPLLADDLRKIVEVIGERNGSSESAAVNLSRATSMVEGLLGPSNTGYSIKRIPGPSKWPLLQVSVLGRDPKAPATWVVSSYDSPSASRGVEANATGLAATLAAAQALANADFAGAIHFLLLPHANDAAGPLRETAEKVSELLKFGALKAVFYVEAMGVGDTLWLSSQDSSAVPLEWVTGLGEIHGAEEWGFTYLLAQVNLPAVRVSTRRSVKPLENEERLPFAPTVAASTGRLIELIRRCAAAPDKGER